MTSFKNNKRNKSFIMIYNEDEIFDMIKDYKDFLALYLNVRFSAAYYNHDITIYGHTIRLKKHQAVTSYQSINHEVGLDKVNADKGFEYLEAHDLLEVDRHEDYLLIKFGYKG